MPRQNSDYIIAAEFQVLKLFLTNPDMDWKLITTSSFPHKQARAFYTAISNLHNSKEVITEGSLFREANKIDDSIDLSLTQHLIEYDIDLSSLMKALEELKEGAVKNTLGDVFEKLEERVSSDDPLDSTEISSLLYQAQDTLAFGGRRIIAKTLEEMFSDYEQEMNLRRLGKYYPFYDEFLDKYILKKAAPGQVILCAGATGTGKSIFGLTLINGMVNAGAPCIYFSPEMDEISTMDRWLAMRSGIDINEWYKSGSELDPLFRKLASERSMLSNKTFRFIDDPEISLESIRHIIREFKMTYKVDYICVFVDLITQIKEFIDTKGNRNTLATIMEIAVNQLNAIAKKENICIFALAQMNREADSTKVESIEDLDKLRPSLNNIKNSNALGERSRTVLSVFRRKYYAERYLPNDPETELMDDILEVQILKQNMGKVGVRGLYLFNGPTFNLMPVQQEVTEVNQPN